MTKVIIIAAGEATRWGNYLNVPKHLIEIDGEPILYRTVRLLLENGMEDIHIVGPEDDDRYRVEGTKLFVPEKDYQRNADADKFLNSESLWNREGRTIVLYGDVFFTEEAMKTICGSTSTDWKLFCRLNGSKITESPWGECFAQSFYTKDLERHKENLQYIAKLYNHSVIKKCGGWEHSRAMAGVKKALVRVHQHYPEVQHIIDDWTEDFDTPEDYDSFMKNWSKK